MSSPATALVTLAAALRDEDSVISPQVVAPALAAEERPHLGLLASSGPRSRERGGEYALLVESVREGYLLHYRSGRVVRGADDDLALLAGDYLYARGLERLAALGDLEAVRELADLISLVAQIHDSSREAGRAAREADRLWLASVLAIASGGSEALERAKQAVRDGSPEAEAALAGASAEIAAAAGLSRGLAEAADAIDFPSDRDH